MKNSLFKLSLLCIAFISLLACSGDDDSSSNNAAVGEFRATIDGNEFSTMNANMVNIAGGSAVTAIDLATNEKIIITINQQVTEGTSYDLGLQTNNIGTAVYNVGSENAFGSLTDGGSGTVTFTMLDEENGVASGTFSFIGVRETLQSDNTILVETVTITNGEFNSIPFQIGVTGNSNNSFEANIDGVALNADAIIAANVTFNGETNTNISAINNTANHLLGLRFPADITVGTYALSGGFSADYQGNYNTNLGSTTEAGIYVSESGTLTITAVNGSTVEGTFSFTASAFIPDGNGPFEITNGTFSVEVQ